MLPFTQLNPKLKSLEALVFFQCEWKQSCFRNNLDVVLKITKAKNKETDNYLVNGVGDDIGPARTSVRISSAKSCKSHDGGGAAGVSSLVFSPFC